MESSGKKREREKKKCVTVKAATITIAVNICFGGDNNNHTMTLLRSNYTQNQLRDGKRRIQHTNSQRIVLLFFLNTQSACKSAIFCSLFNAENRNKTKNDEGKK